ncbi:tripartite motif containing 35-28 [Cololabis saira]|uniref:tripartite motif containing 35-28 n=1 Tax=Cololabis saira TaxID=129043 RepID=UPI002AD42BD0|nr:tripartite motif containing 35-28 [Cololabis saira]
MEVDPPAASLPLQQDLTCPVCQAIFQDAVLLPCSHSFCRACLRRSLEAKRKCPVCRADTTEEQAIPNRALTDASESFIKQSYKNQSQGQNQSRPEAQCCNLHMKPLELYCEKDEEPVCVDCVTLHSTHRLLSIKDGVPLCKKELSFRVQIFEKKLETYNKMVHKLSNGVEYVKYQAGQAEKQIKSEFERLRQMLYTEEALCLRSLASEEEDKINELEMCIINTKDDIADLKKLIDCLKKEMGDDDLPLLQKFRELKKKAHWTESDPNFHYDSLLQMGKHVGGLSFNIWKKMKAHVKYQPVVLDPNTASPWLSLSPDLTSVVGSPERLTVPDNRERFDPCVFVMGAEGYTSGKHKWDVAVGENPKWTLGVCKESLVRKKKFTLSTNRGVWAMTLSKGVYTMSTSERTEVKVQQRPESIRIKLNMDKGEVSFWDGASAKHLVTLEHKFEEKMFPFFGPGLHTSPMVLPAGKIAIHTS